MDYSLDSLMSLGYEDEIDIAEEGILSDMAIKADRASAALTSWIEDRNRDNTRALKRIKKMVERKNMLMAKAKVDPRKLIQTTMYSSVSINDVEGLYKHTANAVAALKKLVGTILSLSASDFSSPEKVEAVGMKIGKIEETYIRTYCNFRVGAIEIKYSNYGEIDFIDNSKRKMVTLKDLCADVPRLSALNDKIEALYDSAFETIKGGYDAVHKWIGQAEDLKHEGGSVIKKNDSAKYRAGKYAKKAIMKVRKIIYNTCAIVRRVISRLSSVFSSVTVSYYNAIAKFAY